MGYDMSIIGAPSEAEKEALAEAEAKLDEIVAKRESVERGTAEWEKLHEEVMEALGEFQSVDKSHFRLNIFGMSRYREAMYALGMMYTANHEKFPDYDSEITEEEYDAVAEPILRSHPGDGKGIPSFKFGSNDGWVVTPEEIEQALSAWNMYLLDDDSDSSYSLEVVEIIGTDYWYEWIEFLTRAKDREGFRVY